MVVSDACHTKVDCIVTRIVIGDLHPLQKTRVSDAIGQYKLADNDIIRLSRS
jgi:hypothetical protein